MNMKLETIKAVRAEIKQSTLEQQSIHAEIKDKQARINSLNAEINQLKETIRITNKAAKNKAEAQQRDTDLRELRAQLNGLIEEKQAVKESLLDLQRQLPTKKGNDFKIVKVQTLLKSYAKEEATAILHAALKRSGLLKSIKEALTLIRMARPEMKKEELNGVLMNLLVDAVTLEHQTFDDALKVLNEKLEDLPAQETQH